MALNKAAVIQAAVELADREGVDGLTLRALATQLGISAPTLYWHVRDKAELLEALADAIMDEVLEAAAKLSVSGGWQQWLLAAAVALRRGLVAHRDGARIVSSARLSLKRADFSELAITTLAGSGLPLAQARLHTLLVERFTIGFVLEEQSSAATTGNDAPDVTELAARLPNATQAIAEYFAPGRTVDDLFQDLVRTAVGLPVQS